MEVKHDYQSDRDSFIVNVSNGKQDALAVLSPLPARAK